MTIDYSKLSIISRNRLLNCETRVKVRSFDCKLLSDYTKKVFAVSQQFGMLGSAKVALSAAPANKLDSPHGTAVTGPITLPTRIRRFTVLRSPHVDKKSREQFEARTYQQLLRISSPFAQAATDARRRAGKQKKERNLDLAAHFALVRYMTLCAPPGIGIELKQSFTVRHC